jgi:hypothetical protein
LEDRFNARNIEPNAIGMEISTSDLSRDFPYWMWRNPQRDNYNSGSNPNSHAQSDSNFAFLPNHTSSCNHVVGEHQQIAGPYGARSSKFRLGDGIG